jgi:PAS domain S-box-containing protein
LFYVKDRTYVRKLRCKNGEYKYIQWDTQKYADDLFVSIGQDVTDQIIAQNQYKNLVETATDIIYESDKYGRFSFMNPVSENVLGFSNNELIGKHFSELIRQDYVDIVSQFYVDFSKSSNDFEVLEFPVIKKNGEQIWISQKVSRRTNESNKIVGYSAFARDVTAKKFVEDALKQSENNFRQLNETIDDVFWLYDIIEKKYIYISPSCKKFFGVSQAELYSGKRSATEFVFIDDKELIKKSNDNILLGQPSEIEYRIKIEDKISWILEKAFTIKNEIGEVVKVSGISTDITAKKQFEDALKESENNFRQINETIEDVFWLYDIKNRKYIYISPSCENVMECPQKDFYAGTSWNIINVHPDDLELYKGAEAILKKIDSYNIEYRLIKKDGSLKWINEKCFAIRNSEGNLIRNSGICIDITEKKLIESQVKQLSLVAEKITNGVLIADTDGKALWANQGYLELFEIPNCELIGKRPRDLFRRGDTELSDKIDKINGTNFKIELAINTFKGNEKWIEINNTTINSNENKIIQQIEIIHEITERVLNKQKIESQAIILKKYSEELEFQNSLKEKLIYASTLEEVTKNALSHIVSQLENSINLHILQLDVSEKILKGFSLNGENLLSEEYNVLEVKSYIECKKGNLFIEKNLRNSQTLSASDEINIQEGIVSYISVPFLIETKFSGMLTIGFSEEFKLDEADIKKLKEAAEIIGFTINQINFKTILEDKNTHITSSINYAKNIQNAILPDLKNNSLHIKDVSLIYRPKDIVSGDFYWTKDINEFTYIAVADCTGHGVPGSFLTLLGNSMLDQLVGEEKLTSPSHILTKLDEQIFTSLNRNRNELMRDGMEIALCIFDWKNKTMQFSGAGLGIVIFIDGIQNYIKGQRKSIGDYRNDDFNFENNTISLKGNERFYIATDGYQDQLGGDKYKRFSKKNYFDLLQKINFLDAAKQEIELNNTINEYIGKDVQTDDITVLGFTIKKN